MNTMAEQGFINLGNLQRFQRVMQRAQRGEPITVAFLGGSITQGSLASDWTKCYAYRVYRWWCEKFPQADVTFINAGIGATTSQFGLARAQDDVLSHQPDVISVEFAVNDRDDVLFQETFEGLIRKLLLADHAPAVYMFDNVQYNDGVNAERVHNAIGFAYKLPICSMKPSIYEAISTGRLVLRDVTPDDLHPNDYGHELVAGVITNLLEKIYTNVMAENVRFPLYQVPATTVTPNRFMNSVRYNRHNAICKADGFITDEAISQGTWDVFKNGWTADKVGDKITMTVNGSKISVQYRKTIHKPAPKAMVTIDGAIVGNAVLDANFEETWGDCLYLQDIAENLHEGAHTIEVIITEVPHNNAAPFYLNAVITA